MSNKRRASDHVDPETQGRYQFIREPDGTTTVKDKQTGLYTFNGPRTRAVNWVRAAISKTSDTTA